MPSLDERSRYNRHESALAAQAEHGMMGGSLWEDVAFLTRYGGVEELEGKGLALAAVLDWWACLGPHAQPADVDAIGSLESAKERLKELWLVAEAVERDLVERWGYNFDRETRRIMRMKEPGEPARSKDLVSEWAVRIFDLMTEKQGWPKRNTKEARDEIRSRLADKVHPDLLGTGKGERIHSALNAHLNPERH